MTIVRNTLPLALAAAVLFVACSQSGTNGGNPTAPSAAAVPEVAGGSLRDALVLGQKTGRNVLLEFYGEGCPQGAAQE